MAKCRAGGGGPVVVKVDVFKGSLPHKGCSLNSIIDIVTSDTDPYELIRILAPEILYTDPRKNFLF